jgi:hypothetical protein
MKRKRIFFFIENTLMPFLETLVIVVCPEQRENGTNSLGFLSIL